MEIRLKLQEFAIRVLGFTCSKIEYELRSIKYTQKEKIIQAQIRWMIWCTLCNNRLKYNFMKKLSLKYKDGPLIVEDVPSMMSGW